MNRTQDAVLEQSQPFFYFEQMNHGFGYDTCKEDNTSLVF